MSKDIMDKLFAIQDAANGCATKREGVEETQTPSPLFSRVHMDTPVEWKRAEILDALKKGATSKALLFSLQAITLLSGDRAFGAEAEALAKPADAGEIWKRAFKTYSRFKSQVEECGRQQDNERACELFGEAVHELAELFVCPGVGSDPMGDELGSAVYSALSKVYEAAEHEAERAAYVEDKGLLGFNWQAAL